MCDQKKEPKSVADIIDDIESRSSGGGFIFRGETQSKYEDENHKGKYHTEVSSKLWRDYKFREEKGIDFDIERVQREMLAGAIEHRGRPAQSSDAGALKGVDILSEIQHYGGKTNLIDFTTDYLIALFFACDGHYAKEGRVILQKKDSIENGKIEKPWNPPHRIIAQKSVFVRPRKGYFYPKEKDVVKIPAGLKESMLKHLEKYHGITKEKIYNDLHGFIYQQEHHGDLYTKFYRGFACHDRRDYKGAIKHYTDATKLSPRFYKTYYNRAIVYHAQGEWDNAIYDNKKAIELNSSFALAYHNLGNNYVSRDEVGDLDKAIAKYSKAIDLDPYNSKTYTARGAAYYMKVSIHSIRRDSVRVPIMDDVESFDKAIEDYSKAIDLDSKGVEAYINRADAYKAICEWAKAIPDYSEAIELKPDNADFYRKRANAYLENGEYDEAIKDYNEVENLDPETHRINGLRARAYAGNEDWRAAIKDYTKAIESEPKNYFLYYGRMMAWIHLQEWDQVRADLPKANAFVLFGDEHKSVDEFEKKTGILLPEDIRDRLARRQ